MEFRKISLVGEKRLARPQGPEPRLDWVEISALVIDDRFQRALLKRNWTSIRRIAEQFDWAYFSPLLVSDLRDGRFSVIDGQHRAHAAALRGIAQVPALVLDELTPEKQAAAFARVNGQVTQLTSVQVYRAALAAREPWAVEADALVASTGCRLMQFNSSARSKKPGDIYCVSAVDRAIRAGHAAHLRAVLTGLRRSSSGEDAASYNAKWIGALLETSVALDLQEAEVFQGFLTAYPIWDLAKRVAKLREQPQYAVMTKRRFLCAALQRLINYHLSATRAA